jgi:hypothetical protein
VGEDRAVPDAVTGVAFRSPLAHPDAVAPTAPVQEEHRRGRRDGGQRESGHDG